MPAAPVIAAIDAGIPVMVVDSDIPDANRLAFFGKDVNVQAQCFLDAINAKLGESTR